MHRAGDNVRKSSAFTLAAERARHVRQPSAVLYLLIKSINRRTVSQKRIVGDRVTPQETQLCYSKMRWFGFGCFVLFFFPQSGFSAEILSVFINMTFLVQNKNLLTIPKRSVFETVKREIFLIPAGWLPSLSQNSGSPSSLVAVWERC